MKILSLFKKKETTIMPQRKPWQRWRSCKNPKTLSFRLGDDMFKTVNSVFFDIEGVETPESLFTNSSKTESFCSDHDSEQDFDGESLEVVVRGARSERLFFEPGDTNSILEEAKSGGFPFKESVVLAMESEDPYVDFRRSMEEMVDSHGLKDWECLKDLLDWYLKVNGKKNHGFIVGAFVDVVVGIAASKNNYNSCSDSTTHYSSAISSFSSSSNLWSLRGQNSIQIYEEEEDSS